MLDYAIASFATFVIGLATYRLFLHPLAKFPGPPLAALTHWYEGYYDAVKGGKYIFEVGKMHEKYGPVVRIGPNELHILDPDYYDTLYSMTNRLDKYNYFYAMLGHSDSSFTTIRADVHRVRRSALNPFFSVQAVVALQPTLWTLIDRLCSRMEASAKRNESIPLTLAFRCLTIDITSEYEFGSALGLLDRADWGRSFYYAWRSLWEVSPTIRQLPFLLDLIMLMPRWLTARTSPEILDVINMQTFVDERTKKIMEAEPETLQQKGHPIVVAELFKSELLPLKEKAFKRISIDAYSVLAAGFETTGALLSLVTFHILEQPQVHQRVRKELEAAIPDPKVIPSWQSLEKLPYLSSVVREGLRLNVGAYSRLPRVNPTKSMQFRRWEIPPNTAVGMSALFVMKDPTIFPDPELFQPERWLEPTDRRRLERYLVPFGRGSRACLGINMAYFEIYTVLATIFRRFPNLELYQTSKEDMEYVHDFFAGMTRHDSEGCRVRLGPE